MLNFHRVAQWNCTESVAWKCWTVCVGLRNAVDGLVPRCLGCLCSFLACVGVWCGRSGAAEISGELDTV